MTFICQLSFDEGDHHFDDSHHFHGCACRNINLGLQKQGRRHDDMSDKLDLDHMRHPDSRVPQAWELFQHFGCTATMLRADITFGCLMALNKLYI